VIADWRVGYSFQASQQFFYFFIGLKSIITGKKAFALAEFKAKINKFFSLLMKTINIASRMRINQYFFSSFFRYFRRVII
jgi:hypothetical protein